MWLGLGLEGEAEFLGTNKNFLKSEDDSGSNHSDGYTFLKVISSYVFHRHLMSFYNHVFPFKLRSSYGGPLFDHLAAMLPACFEVKLPL